MSTVMISRSAAEARLDKMLVEYHDTLPFFPYHIPFRTSDPLRDAIEASPELKERLIDSIQLGYLRKFTNAEPEAGARAEHKVGTREILVPERALDDRHDLIFVLGHENAHALNARGINAKDQIKSEIRAIARGPQPHDYTAPIMELVEHTLADEAQAHIGGFNAAVSALRKAGLEPTEKNLYAFDPARMRDFIEVRGKHPDMEFVLKDGLTRDPSTKILTANAENIEAMKGYYPDKIPGTFGENGLLNYRHTAILDGWTAADGAEREVKLEAATAKIEEFEKGKMPEPKSGPGGLPEKLTLPGGLVLVGMDVPDFEDPDLPKVFNDAGYDRAEYKIDFKQLGVSPLLLDVSRFGNDGIIPIQIDMTSGQPEKARAKINGHLDYLDVVVSTGTFHRLQADLNGNVPPQPRTPSVTTTTTTPDAVTSPQRTDALPPRLYEQALDGIGRAGIEDLKGQDRLNVAAALALEAHKQGLPSIDFVVPGAKGNVFAVSGDNPHSDTALRANVDIETARQQPARDSNAQLLSLLSQPTQPTNTYEQQHTQKLTQ
ncbi:XVIPCD domain-containing protein [Luteimonas panaciterrae]|uniref:XVIPCD domain-containing protein n=1 Tax=Luteimonas panaciterrae TaxID=363885 RepID=UPI001CF9A43C|nr:XVIPCD domain-containing protein [Luteimonas panaciterrae]